MREAQNLVLGNPVRSSGGRFEVHEPLEPWNPLGSWPRSTAADVGGAMDELARAADRWGQREVGERCRTLDAAGRSLARPGEEEVWLSSRLGLGSEEALARRSRFELSGQPRGGKPSTAVWIPDWTELIDGDWRHVARELAGGNRLVLLPDARVPLLADRMVEALLKGGIEPEALVLLHGADEEALAAAIQRPEVGAVLASGDGERVRWLRGLVRQGVRADLRLKRCRAVEVERGQDLERRAEQVVQQAFGRLSVLSGQLPGQVGRVFCDESCFSEFTEAVVAQVDRLPRPLPLIDREAVGQVRKSWALGLDEGATLIRGGAELEGTARRCLAPTVFTNVEASMQSARRVGPEPVLCLLRGSPEAQGIEVRGRSHPSP